MAAADKILIVEDDPQHLFMLTTLAGDWGYASQSARGGEEAVALAAKRGFSLILMDVRLGMGPDGLEVMRRIREGPLNRDTPVIIMTALMNYPDAVQAIKDGASDYLTKPLDFEALRKSMDRALRERAGAPPEEGAARAPLRAPGRRAAPRPEREGGGFLQGVSPAFRNVMTQVALAASTDSVVLITGESGVGKEVIAKLIQEGSARRGKPFITINCAALSDTLVESELFGHRKGAFTGADQRREGRIKAGDGGTVFLDEIAETSTGFQAKLLRTIQQQEIQPLGSDEAERVDVRFIVATNRDIKREVEEGRFRRDLYYRIEVITVHVPPLRERREDILPLANHFVRRFAAQHGREEIKGLGPKAEEAVLRYAWPGNIRELQNAMERAVLLSTSEWVTEKFLPRAEGEAGAPVASTELPLNLDELERMAVGKAMGKSKGNKTEAARILGITRKTLAAKLEKYGDKAPED